MELVLYVSGIAVAALFLFISGTLIRAGFTHVFTRSDILRDAEAHSPSEPLKVVRGEIDAYRGNDKRDSSIAAGIARDTKTKKLMLQGRVSDEVVETLV